MGGAHSDVSPKKFPGVAVASRAIEGPAPKGTPHAHRSVRLKKKRETGFSQVETKGPAFWSYFDLILGSKASVLRVRGSAPLMILRSRAEAKGKKERERRGFRRICILVLF